MVGYPPVDFRLVEQVSAVAFVARLPGALAELLRTLAIGGRASDGEGLGHALLVRWDANRCTPNPEFTDTVRTRASPERGIFEEPMIGLLFQGVVVGATGLEPVTR